MRFFKSKPVPSSHESSITPTVDHTLFVGLEKLKRNAADYMCIQSERLSTHQKRLVFVMACCIACGGCAAMIVHAVQGDSKMSSIIPVRINVPPVLHSQIQAAPIVTDAQYKRLLKFKNSCDSLQRSEGGMILYEDMIRSRPGLMDSVDFLISIH